MPVISRVADFDHNSGSLLERLIFNYRAWLVAACAAITVIVGIAALRLEINASFENMMPQSQEFIRNYLAYANSLRGLGNSVRIVVENTKGDIYTPNYLAALRDINDEVYLIPGVDRSFVKSLWMPVVRWTEITEQGYKGGSVMPDTYNGSPESLETLRQNVLRAGIIGSLVANDQKSSMIFLPLLDRDAVTGKALDYRAFRDRVDEIRHKYEKNGIRIRVIGFAQLVGDLIHGLIQILAYFGIAAVIATFIIYLYTRCVRSTAIVVTCSLIAVAWQMGVMRLLGLYREAEYSPGQHRSNDALLLSLRSSCPMT